MRKNIAEFTAKLVIFIKETHFPWDLPVFKEVHGHK